MRILLSGGLGYIGSHTAISLLQSGFEIVIFDNHTNSRPIMLERLQKLSGERIPFYLADMLDALAMDQIFNEYDIDAVIHFAALKSVSESVEYPLRYYHNNVTGTSILLESMYKHGVKNIVFSSSATVYGEANVSPYTEDMPTGTCSNPYGQTKVIVENMLKDIYKSDSDWNISILRYFNPTGAHESGKIGESPSGVPANLCPFIAQTAAGMHPYVRVYGADYDTPDGTGVRDYIHIADLASGHIAALKQMKKSGGLSIYNLGTGRGFSVLELIHMFSKITGREIPYLIENRRNGDLAIAVADPSLAYHELGWKTKHSLERMCEDAWRWQCLNPEWRQAI